jgi:dienelactone hydrolase
MLRVSRYSLAFLISMALLMAPGLQAGEASTARSDNPTEPTVNCSAFVVTGDPRSAGGATWTYQSTDSGTRYVLEGVLFLPAGAGPFPAVIISHGKGGAPRGYSANVARNMVAWGLVAIGVMYTHAPDGEDLGNEPAGDDGASQANVLRAHKARDLVSCVGNVDMRRVAAHGHSMGAFVTGQLLGSYPSDFRAASHTAGGVSEGPNATRRAAAEQIVTPYQLHHGDADMVVALFQDQTLDSILTANDIPHELNIYTGHDHQEMTLDTVMLERVHNWYRAHGVLQTDSDESGPRISAVSLDGKRLTITGDRFSNAPGVTINDKERSKFIVAASETTIELRAKQKKLGVAAGDNSVVVTDASGKHSNVFVLKR